MKKLSEFIPLFKMSFKMTDQVCPFEFETDNDKKWKCNSWKIILCHKKRRIGFPYYTGQAIDRPVLGDVLSSLQLDLQTARNYSTFEDWAQEFGYDPDSRKAFNIFQASQALGWKFSAMIGDSLAEEILNAENDI